MTLPSKQAEEDEEFNTPVHLLPNNKSINKDMKKLNLNVNLPIMNKKMLMPNQKEIKFNKIKISKRK